MVSLNRNFNTSTGGGVFFNDNSVNDDDTQRLYQPFGATPVLKFMPVNTLAAVTLQLLLCMGMAIATIVFAVAWPERFDQCEPLLFIFEIHAAFWCVSLLIQSHIQEKHHQLRVNGYLEFYRKIRTHSSAPFYLTSLWNALLLVLSAVYRHLYDNFDKQCMASGFSKPVYHLCLAIGVEVMILTFFLSWYIMKVAQFNKSRPPPDVLREEWMISFIQDSYSGGEIGYRDPGDQINELLEKQADLIRYLIDRNDKLSQKIFALRNPENEDNS